MFPGQELWHRRARGSRYQLVSVFFKQIWLCPASHEETSSVSSLGCVQSWIKCTTWSSQKLSPSGALKSKFALWSLLKSSAIVLTDNCLFAQFLTLSTFHQPRRGWVPLHICPIFRCSSVSVDSSFRGPTYAASYLSTCLILKSFFNFTKNWIWVLCFW